MKDKTKDTLKMNKKIKTKQHKHKWVYDYNDCAKCGGYEQRFCDKEGCFEHQIYNNNKWESE